MPLTKMQKDKLIKLKNYGSWRADCCVCGKPLDSEADTTEYAKTKRKTEVFFHRECVRRWNR
mgnify:FL=1